MHGLMLLDNILQVHGCPIARQILPMLWRLLTADDVAQRVECACYCSVILGGLYVCVGELPPCGFAVN